MKNRHERGGSGSDLLCIKKKPKSERASIFGLSPMGLNLQLKFVKVSYCSVVSTQYTQGRIHSILPLSPAAVSKR
jgi:hypothetical protein